MRRVRWRPTRGASSTILVEMICADFLACAHTASGDPEILVNSLARSFMLLNEEQKLEFLGRIELRGQKLAS